MLPLFGRAVPKHRGPIEFSGCSVILRTPPVGAPLKGNRFGCRAFGRLKLRV